MGRCQLGEIEAGFNALRRWCQTNSDLVVFAACGQKDGFKRDEKLNSLDREWVERATGLCEAAGDLAMTLVGVGNLPTLAFWDEKDAWAQVAQRCESSRSPTPTERWLLLTAEASSQGIYLQHAASIGFCPRHWSCFPAEIIAWNLIAKSRGDDRSTLSAIGSPAPNPVHLCDASLCTLALLKNILPIELFKPNEKEAAIIWEIGSRATRPTVTQLVEHFEFGDSSISDKTLRLHLKSLEAYGLVTRPAGIKNGLFLTERGQALLSDLSAADYRKTTALLRVPLAHNTPERSKQREFTR